jgi:hypothetical protein
VIRGRSSVIPCPEKNNRDVLVPYVYFSVGTCQRDGERAGRWFRISLYLSICQLLLYCMYVRQAVHICMRSAPLCSVQRASSTITPLITSSSLPRSSEFTNHRKVCTRLSTELWSDQLWRIRCCCYPYPVLSCAVFFFSLFLLLIFLKTPPPRCLVVRNAVGCDTPTRRDAIQHQQHPLQFASKPVSTRGIAIG